MNTREQFGKYLLLKKLTEDPLGETFRAGMLGEGGMERVVLLRIFNGQGVDGARLWNATQNRQGVQDLLRSPTLGEGVDMGEIEGLPFVAYDYISGKNAATLLEQAAKQQNFVPAEHALLITERVALGLASAAECRHQGERVIHGFLCPHLVMISNEGESRLLGFEIAQGLRGFAANPVIRQHFGRYLAPEALAGAPADPADDIYSLGVLLLELLTGRPLPPPGPDGFHSVIDRSIVATEEGPIAEELRNLLKRSLVPREHRIPDAATWHKTLNSWMFEGQYNPTTFNLAFFMHNLFRQDIEIESQEIEAEKTLPLPVQKPTAAAPPPPAAAAAAAAAPAAPFTEGTGTGVVIPNPDEKTENFIPEYAKDDEGSSKKGLFIGIGVAAALLAIGAFFFMGGSDKTDDPATQVATQPAPPPEPVVEDTGPSEEELRAQMIEAQLAELVEKKATDMEEELRKGYDKQLEDLQKQLVEAQADAERKKQEEADRLAKEEADRLLAEQQAAEEEAARIAEAERQKKEADEAAAAAKLAEEQKAKEEAAAVAAPPPAPKAPAVRRGDLVEMGPGVVVPELLRRPTPRFPEMARRLNKKEARVLVRVLIDETGKVVKAEVAGKKQGFGFDDEALSAARKSVYKPATKNGVPVKFWHTIVMQFKRN